MRRRRKAAFRDSVLSETHLETVVLGGSDFKHLDEERPIQLEMRRRSSWHKQ